MNTPIPDRLVRTSIYLPTDMLARIKMVAARRHTTAAHLIRESLEKTLGDHRPAPRGGFLP